MAQIDDFLKMLDEQDFARASAKQRKKTVKKTPEEMLADEIQKITIKDKAKEATAKPLTRQQLIAQRTKQLKSKRELQEEKRKSTPSEDILRFGKKRQQFRDLAYKTSAVQRKEDGENVVDQEGKPVRDLIFTEIPGNELFKEQAQAYGDSLKLAGLAQKFGTTTPDIRKIDRNRGEITNEILANVKKYMKEASGLDPKVQRELAEKRATQDLIKKYGKGIIPLLTQLKNR
tara:strand:+ start:1397 stop:2089 length:693 start_codon:yes stop_codon:yes gene_type:complete